MIIEELDKEGINLQETILNLENQGYKLYYNLWIEQIMNSILNEIAKTQLKKHNLI